MSNKLLNKYYLLKLNIPTYLKYYLGTKFIFVKKWIQIQPEGNTSQESTQGIQLFAYPYYENSVTRDGITFTVKSDGTIHVQGTATAKTSFTLRNRDLFLNINEGDTYTLVASGLGVVDSTVWLDTAGQTGNFLDKWALQESSNYATAVAQSKDKKPLIKITVENGATINTDIQILLYKGSYDSSKKYEPYTGGLPSPNPDYPQTIKNVTGNNTVIITGQDQNSNIQPIEKELNLGNIELCKIGDYQDYIYKNNNKWYKKEYIGKTTDTSGSTGKTISDIISDSSFYSYYGGSLSGKTITYTKAIPDTNTIYYPKTATDIQITDTTLINQLEDLYRIKIPGGTIIVETESESENAQLLVTVREI